MAKLTLTDLANLQNENTAIAIINSNSAATETAMEKTLSRDGTTPNEMENVLDMNSFQILNLPAPTAPNSPLRLQDLIDFTGGGTITGIPVGGATNQVLTKLSAADYNVGWSSPGAVTAGTNISVAGVNPYVVSTIANPTFATSVTTPSLVLNGTTVNGFTGTGNIVLSAAPTLTGNTTVGTINKITLTAPATAAILTIPDNVTLTGPAASGTVMTLGNAEVVTGAKTFGAVGNVGKLIVAGTTSGTITINATAVAGSNTLTLPAETATLITAATTKTLTNTTFDTAGTGNSFSINGVAATANTGTGSVVRSASPTFTGAPVLAAPTATTMQVGATALGGYISRITGGNANQLAIDNAGEQFTEFDYFNNNSIKATTFYDNTGNLFAFRTTGAAFIRFDTSNTPRMTISAGAGDVSITGGFATASPATKTANYTMVIGDSSLIFNQAATSTLTLLAASAFPGRDLLVKTIQAQTVVSAASNVVPKTGGAAGTAILPATAGAWAFLKSDGTNWQIMASGT